MTPVSEITVLSPKGDTVRSTSQIFCPACISTADTTGLLVYATRVVEPGWEVRHCIHVTEAEVDDYVGLVRSLSADLREQRERLDATMSDHDRRPAEAVPLVRPAAYQQLRQKGLDEQLTLDELACALYEGTAHLQNLAEKLARQHGQAEALTFYDMMGDDVQNFWRLIAKQLIDHAREWEQNSGSACVLSLREVERLAALARVG